MKIKKIFGNYEVVLDTKVSRVKIAYVCTYMPREVYKENLTCIGALEVLRDMYLRKGTAQYEAAKAFLWPYIEKEF